MKNSVLYALSLSLFLTLVLVGVSACDKDQTTNPVEQAGSVSGIVTSAAKAPLVDVTVKIGTKTATTNAIGYFKITGISVAANVLVDFTKTGYISTQRVVTVQSGKDTFTGCSLFSPTVQTFPASTQMYLYDTGLQLVIPADAFVTSSNTPFTGTVRAETYYFDPTSPAALDAFPGNFSGILEGTEVMFESYGFLSATFYDDANPATVLQLGAGKTVDITGVIPSSLLDNAPATIPMWYYNESTGKWMQEGFADKVGGTYQGSVSHFTYWNFDYPVEITDQATLTGTVVMNDENSTPVADAQVVATGVNYAGYTRAFSDTDGHFSITVKANSVVRIQAFQGSNSSPLSSNITTPAGGQTQSVGSLVLNDYSFIIMGTLVDTSNVPLTGSSGILFEPNPASSESISPWIFPDAAGAFIAEVANTNTGSQVSVIAKLYSNNQYMFSSLMNFAIPTPGSVIDLGNIVMYPPAHLTGRAKDNTGTWLSNTYMMFNKAGMFSEGTMMNTSTDSLGYFDLEGPPNVTMTNMVGTAWIDNSNYESPSITLPFPASGNTAQLGELTFSPPPTKKRR